MSCGSDEKLCSALGFAMKAGRVKSGETAVEKALKGGKAYVAVIDSGASDNTKKRWTDICENAGVPVLFCGDVGRAIGREAHMVACITDKGFAQMALRACKENDPNFGGEMYGKE